MRTLRLAALALLAAVSVVGQEPKTSVSVTELPPETIPGGTCAQSTSGYLGIVGKDKTERTKLTDKEIGQYVSKSLAQGYSVALYPQASGKVFTIATCHSIKP
jgi:hypothetical protein